jgi:hypothetical protein
MSQNEGIFWVHTITGEDIITYGILRPNVLEMERPTLFSSSQGYVILVPYGLGLEKPVISLQRESILWMEEASKNVRKLYMLSLDIRTRTQTAYDSIIEKALEMYQGSGEREPTDSELKDIEAEELRDRNLKDIVDNLVDLAEKAGKGRKRKDS